MLTQNLAEIIAVVIEKSQHNTLETFSSDEIRSISLMLCGYLRLIKTEFKTADDSSEPSESYYASLKGVLNLLTTTQKKLLQKMKQEFIVDFNADLDSMVSKIESTKHISALDSTKNLDKKRLSTSLFKKSINELKVTVGTNLLDPYVGFMNALKVCFHESSIVMELVKGMAKSESTQTISRLHDLFQETFNHHLKKWSKWIEIEQTNQQCISYVSCSDFIGLW